MRFFRNRIRRDERGASLILAIAFMLVAGTIGASLLRPVVASSALDRSSLDNLRNRQYDADAAIERSIARIRAIPVSSNPSLNAGSNSTECNLTANPSSPGPGDSFTGPNTSQTFRVDCANTPSVSANPSGTPVSQANVTFVACLGSALCTPTSTIITARVNFQVVSGQVVTFVQSWSVNG